jgi:hypothetical protein
MNNCLHSWPYSWGLPQDKWRQRLHLFLGALQLNLQELAQSSFQGEFGFQACMPLACTEHFAWRLDWGIDQCPAQNSELMAVNTAVRRLFSAMHIRGSFVSTWDSGLRDTQNYIDGVHPCFTRPCSWAGKDGKPVPGGTPISNPKVPQYNGLADLPSSICLSAAERMWGRLKTAKWPISKKWFDVAVPDISDLSAEKFINAVPPVSAAVLRALAPKPIAVKPPVQPHPVYMATSGPTSMESLSVAGGTGAPIIGGVTGAPASFTTGAPAMLAGGAASRTSRPSLVVGTLPPGAAANMPQENHSMPAWMWVLIAFLVMVCSSQIWGQVDGQKKSGKSAAKSQAAAFGLLSVVEFDSDEVELASESH